MSSNMWACYVVFEFQGRKANATVVFVGTSEELGLDGDWARSKLDGKLEDQSLSSLARYELALRAAAPDKAEVLDVWCSNVWHNADDPSDPTWIPPYPSTEEVLQAVATGQAWLEREGWDT